MDNIEKIKKLRNCGENCLALKKVLLPDDIYENWLKVETCSAKNPEKNGHHRSILSLAVKRETISKLIAPVAKYSVKEDGESRFTDQYLGDLNEKWLFESSPAKRHKKFRMFMGKLVELHCAYWLENNNWKIEDLEAWKNGANKKPDILAKCPKNESYAIEVKYIGLEDDDFQALLSSLERKTQARSICPYRACNYALFRIYEAAKQFDKCKEKRKIAVLVLDATAWPLLETQLKENWMAQWGWNLCWNGQVKQDCKWIRFYISKKNEKKFQEIDSEMPKVIKALSQIYIMTIDNWELKEKKVINLTDE